jgi:hypothetical protein
MEIDGHPTQDIIEELERRGAIRATGGAAGPHDDAVRFILERVGQGKGFWLFVPEETYQTGFDELPGP